MAPTHCLMLARLQWPGLLFISICFAINVGLNNVSLTTISLSLNQVIRCVAVRATTRVPARAPERHNRLGAMLCCHIQTEPVALSRPGGIQFGRLTCNLHRPQGEHPGVHGDRRGRD